jgi:tetratricopeptide (TPR) repeat protein
MRPGAGRSRAGAVIARLFVSAAVSVGAGAARAQAPAPAASPTPADAPARKAPTLDAGLTPAFRLVRAGRYAEARQAAEAYLAASGAPHPGQAQFILALSYHRQRLYEAADRHFVRALDLEPDYVTAYFFHGFTLLNLGRLDDARKAFEAYLAKGPEDAEAVFGLGLVALEQDRVEDAERAFLRAIEMVQSKAGPTPSPDAREDLARYHARLGDVHLRSGDLARARADLERSVELWPDHFEPWHKLAGVLRRLGDAAGADRAQARSDEAFRRRTSRGSP